MFSEDMVGQVWQCDTCKKIYEVCDVNGDCIYFWKKRSKRWASRRGIQQAQKEQISDDHGSTWEKCGLPECDLHVVRPGKAQCNEHCAPDIIDALIELNHPVAADAADEIELQRARVELWKAVASMFYDSFDPDKYPSYAEGQGALRKAVALYEKVSSNEI